MSRRNRSTKLLRKLLRENNMTTKIPGEIRAMAERVAEMNLGIVPYFTNEAVKYSGDENRQILDYKKAYLQCYRDLTAGEPDGWALANSIRRLEEKFRSDVCVVNIKPYGAELDPHGHYVPVKLLRLDK